MLIAISNYLKPLTEVDKFRAAHLDYIKPFFMAGKLLVGGRQNPPDGAVIIAKSASRAEFENILAQDPYTQEGLAEYKIIEFNTALCAPVAEKLFS